MSNTETMQARIRDPDAIPRIALYGFLAVVVGLSTVGWISTFEGPAGWVGAGFAAVNEVLIFFGLPKILDHINQERWPRLIALILVLVLASPISILGVDQGLTVASRVVQAPIDDQVASEQRQRANARKTLQDEIDEITARLRALDATMPNPETTNATRQSQWLENRNTVAARDEARLPEATAELAALLETIPARHAYPEWMRHMVAGLLFFISAIGRYSWGFEGAVRENRAPGPRKPKAPQHPRQEAPQTAPNVIDLGAKRGKRGAHKTDPQTVQRLIDAGYSESQIVSATGLSKGGVHRMKRKLKAS